MNAVELYGREARALLPGQPSLRYPATREERREVLEEKAENQAEMVLKSLIDAIVLAADEFRISFSTDDAIDLIDGVWKREFKK